jgi:hypothetical protein
LCEAETCHARLRLVVGIPLVGNWSEMQPSSRRLDVLNLGLDTFNLGLHDVNGVGSCVEGKSFHYKRGALIRALVNHG